MNYRYTAAVAIGLLFGIAASGWTNNPSTSVSTNTFISLDNTAGTSIEGTVQKVDIHEASLNIKDPYGNVKMVTIDHETQILRDGVPIQLVNLRPGDTILIRNPQLILIPNSPPSAAD